MSELNFEKQLKRMERDGVITRAQFLQLMAVAGAFIMLGTDKAYAAKSNARGRIVIIGGGAAGISMAARLKRLLKNPDITIIDPSDRQYYQPGFTLIAGGVYGADDVWKPQDECMPDDVKWIKDSVTLVHPAQNRVETLRSGILDYDYLVLAPGIQINWDKVEGISLDTLGAGNAHSIYDHRGAQLTWPAMKEFAEKGGRGIFCDTYTKHKCGGAPKKICLLSWDNARKNGTTDRLDMTYYTAETQVDMMPFKKTSTPFTEDYDFMHFMAPQSAPDFVRESGLSWTEGKLAADGWAMVDQQTLIHKTYPNIISLGDCAGIPTSKTSAAVRKQVPIAVENLIATMEGRRPEAIYDGYAACPIVTDYGHVLLCEFDYDKNPKISFPFSLFDMSKEQWVAWILKVYILKPFYFHMMLKGRDF